MASLAVGVPVVPVVHVHFGHFRTLILWCMAQRMAQMSQNRVFYGFYHKIHDFVTFGHPFGRFRLEFGLLSGVKVVILLILHPGVYESDVFSTHSGISDVHDLGVPFKTRVYTH